MPTRTMTTLAAAFALTLTAAFPARAQAEPPEGEGWISLFNGEDFSGWQVPEDGPWAIVDGTIDCDPKRSPGVGGNVQTEESFDDFVLHVEWRIKDTPTEDTFPVILPDGSSKTDENGNVVTQTFPNADSGLYLRGQPKAQINIWNWPIGSGEVYGYRTDGSMPAEVREGVTPDKRADNPIGEWNTFRIRMVDDRLTVHLNDERIIDDVQLPGVSESGPLILQHHGGYNAETDEYHGASSLVQFRNIYIKPVD